MYRWKLSLHIYIKQVSNLQYNSRYYRAPEVIFGLKYGMEIDMWSFACLVSEIHTG